MVPEHGRGVGDRQGNTGIPEELLLEGVVGGSDQRALEDSEDGVVERVRERVVLTRGPAERALQQHGRDVEGDGDAAGGLEAVR